MKNVISILIVALILASCTKEDNLNPNNPQDDDVLVHRIVETTDNLSVESFYEYNGNKIVSITKKDAVTGLLHSTQTYTYTGDLITSTVREYNEDFSSSPDHIETYEYDNQNRLSVRIIGSRKQEFDYSLNDTVISNTYNLIGGSYQLEQTDKYIFANHNLMKIERYDNNGNQTSNVYYTFDDKNHFYKNIIGLNVSEFGTSHNVTQIEIYNLYDGVEEANYSTISTSDFQYNSEDYPVSMTFNLVNGSQNITKTYQYYYE